ncbi:LlaJI family restriction endonuclease [Fibrobacter intestinalis]|uniref:LlaJI family restriction endonuclease n=1 Tax=Fibrobacter intestinalis TaxID=28122 RepID=UPI0023F1BDA1|nr:LlaJI family restriction endonuclease [Fibrobacter intestinalis]MDD7298997.1 LlaJI family restriction endonuclease [Fibrobacter intestinalis]
MIFLFEQFAYSEKFLQSVLPLEKKGGNWDLPKGFVTKSKSGEFVLDGVGYLYNKSAKGTAKDSDDKIVFVLPKVFLEEGGKAFGKEVKGDANFTLENAPKDFLANLSMWVCSSIAQYQKLHPNDRAIESPNVHRFGSDAAAPTLIDVMNAMKLFYAENKNLFVFTAKNKHSGNNRIDWRRTVAHTQPFMQGDAPIYMELENKKKVFDLDDRLLVLYFSAMHYIEETFGFKMPHSEFYAPMRVNEFRRLLGHRGLVELRRIKHKYFADKFLRLYNIEKAFFEWGGNFSASDYSSEYLLTSKYNNVFEAMIDKLVGDDLPNGMKYLKDQKDGKIIDHLYKDRQLIFADEEQKIWFIGDSKYYSDGKKIEGSSVYKQFTYAKNIIQYNIGELLGNGKSFNGLRYRDELTEGYSVTPNFFIRGYLPNSDGDRESPQFREPYFRNDTSEELIKNEEDSNSYQLIDDEGNPIGSNKGQSLWNLRNRHFENRLFDRDTLLLQVYNVNFLYVLKAYTSKRSSLRDEFKRDAREKFRKNFLNLLRDKYYFWAIYLPDWQKPDYAERLQDFVDRHFRALVGRVFQPAETPHCLILALERDVVDKSKEGDKDDYRAIRKIVDEAKCEVFYIWPHEIWEDEDLRKNCGWKAIEK